MLWKNMAQAANLVLMRVRQIVLEEEPSMLVMKNEWTLAQQRRKLENKNISGRGASLCKDQKVKLRMTYRKLQEVQPDWSPQCRETELRVHQLAIAV